MPKPHPYTSSLPAPPRPALGAPQVFSSPSGHVVLFIYPWADDDHGLVVKSMADLIEVMHKLFPQPGDTR